MYGTHGHGADSQSMSTLYSAGCSITPKDLEVIALERRDFNTTNGIAKIAKFQFKNYLMTHEENKFSADGELIGKKQVSHSGGWIGRGALRCGNEESIPLTKSPDTESLSKTSEQRSSTSLPAWCPNASTQVEKWICANDQLMADENEFNRQYLIALSRSQNKDITRNSVAEWKRNYRNKCQDANCIHATYQAIITELLSTNLRGN